MCSYNYLRISATVKAPSTQGQGPGDAGQLKGSQGPQGLQDPEKAVPLLATSHGSMEGEPASPVSMRLGVGVVGGQLETPGTASKEARGLAGGELYAGSAGSAGSSAGGQGATGQAGSEGGGSQVRKEWGLEASGPCCAARTRGADVDGLEAQVLAHAVHRHILRDTNLPCTALQMMPPNGVLSHWPPALPPCGPGAGRHQRKRDRLHGLAGRC